MLRLPANGEYELKVGTRPVVMGGQPFTLGSSGGIGGVELQSQDDGSFNVLPML